MNVSFCVVQCRSRGLVSRLVQTTPRAAALRSVEFWGTVITACGFIFLLTGAEPIAAQILVSANDGKLLKSSQHPGDRTPDTVAVIDAAARPARILAEIQVPASLNGPPASVAVTPDARFAIISAAQRVDGDAVVPSDRISLVDVRNPAQPRIAQSISAGLGASGLALDRAGKLLLVTNATDGTVSVFKLRAGRLTASGTISLGKSSKPVDIGFSRDQNMAYVVAQGTAQLISLRVQRDRVTQIGAPISLGMQPDSLTMGRSADLAYVTNFGGRADGATNGAPKTGTIAIVDLVAGRVVEEIDAGATPEHVGISPSGRYLQSTVINGSSAPEGSVAFHPFGIMRVYSVAGARLVPVAETKTGRWCQGAAWSDDEARIFLQCADAKQIEVYDFDGHGLTRDEAATLQLTARPGAIASARSH